MDTYKRPYDERNPVVCMDETPQQLIEETRIPIPQSPGLPARHDYEYKRNGVCNIFVASEPLAGKRYAQVTEYKKKEDWAKFMAFLADKYPDADKITMVLDKLGHTQLALFMKPFRLKQQRH